MELVPDAPNLAEFMDPLRKLIEEHVEQNNINGVTVSVLYAPTSDSENTRYRTYSFGLCLADAVFGLALAIKDAIDNCEECDD